MKERIGRHHIALRALMIAAILMTVCLAAATAESAVFISNSRVYQYPTLSSRYIAIPNGVEVDWVGNENGWAKVQRAGITAYTNPAHLASYSVSPVETGTDAVITEDTYVFQYPSISSAHIRVSRGLRIKLLTTEGAWARVANGGIVAYMNAQQVSTDLSAAAQTAAQTYDVSQLLANAKQAVINVNTFVFQSPTTSSAHLAVPQGMSVNLLAVNGQWAMVENNGVIAYMNYAHLSPAGTQIETPQATAAPDYAQMLANAQEMTVQNDAYAYIAPDTTSQHIAVQKGTTVKVLAVNGSWAMISNGSFVAYMETSAFTAQQSAAQTPDYSSLLASAKDAVLNKDAKVYRSPDTSSESVTVQKGASVKALAVQNGWALIEMGGNYGYIASDALSEPAPSTPTTPPAENYLTTSNLTNEEKCYYFLTREAGLSTAAASGILANIYRESRFNPGDVTGRYYGLVQWGDGRLTNMKNYCSSNGYSYTTVEGQLRFIVYEMQKSYSNVWNYLKAVDNTPQGAYDAGYYFCYWYERPAARESASVSRGNLAKETFYPRYLGK